MTAPVRIPVVQGTPAWLAARRELITATDVGVLLGVNPWRCEADLADEKLNGTQVESTLRMRIGTALGMELRVRNTSDRPMQIEEALHTYLAVSDVRQVSIAGLAGGFYALFTICTHLGCTPNFLSAENKFKCPCHGSGFYKDGINFEGPAPRPLELQGLGEGLEHGVLGREEDVVDVAEAVEAAWTAPENAGAPPTVALDRLHLLGQVTQMGPELLLVPAEDIGAIQADMTDGSRPEAEQCRADEQSGTKRGAFCVVHDRGRFIWV